MAVTNKAWDGSSSRWPDAQAMAKSCLINTNTGDPANWSKDGCKLPIREPNGDLNSNALGPALGALNGARGGLKGVSPAQKKVAAKKLMSAYREAKMDIPDSLKNMAR